MVVLPENCKSWWDIKTPETAARDVIRVYGEKAAYAAAVCGLEATAAGREEDYRFWIEVFNHLKSARGARGAKLYPAGNA